MLHAAKASTHEKGAERAPQSLRERVCRTLLDERVRAELNAEPIATDEEPSAEQQQQQSESDEPVPSLPRSEGLPAYAAKLRYIVPLAAAATFALLVGAASLSGDRDLFFGSEAPVARETPTASPTIAQAQATIDTLIDDLITQHAHPPQLDVTDPNEPLELRPILDKRLNGTSFEQDFGAKYIGARKTPRAGLLQYVKRNKNRVTMYVFNTRRVQVRSDKLKARRIGARKVYVGKVKGYPVAASEREDGIGFALTADDLSADEASSLVLAAAR
jgi:hypothetical protein